MSLGMICDKKARNDEFPFKDLLTSGEAAFKLNYSASFSTEKIPR